MFWDAADLCGPMGETEGTVGVWRQKQESYHYLIAQIQYQHMNPEILCVFFCFSLSFYFHVPNQ